MWKNRSIASNEIIHMNLLISTKDQANGDNQASYTKSYKEASYQLMDGFQKMLQKASKKGGSSKSREKMMRAAKIIAGYSSDSSSSSSSSSASSQDERSRKKRSVKKFRRSKKYWRKDVYKFPSSRSKILTICWFDERYISETNQQIEKDIEFLQQLLSLIPRSFMNPPSATKIMRNQYFRIDNRN